MYRQQPGLTLKVLRSEKFPMVYILTQYFLPYLLHFHVILGHLKQKPGSLRSLSVSRTFLDFDLNHNFFVVVVYIRGRLATVAPSRGGTICMRFTKPLPSTRLWSQSYTNREKHAKYKDNSKIKIVLQGQPLGIVGF